MNELLQREAYRAVRTCIALCLFLGRRYECCKSKLQNQPDPTTTEEAIRGHGREEQMSILSESEPLSEIVDPPLPEVCP